MLSEKSCTNFSITLNVVYINQKDLLLFVFFKLEVTYSRGP